MVKAELELMKNDDDPALVRGRDACSEAWLELEGGKNDLASKKERNLPEAKSTIGRRQSREG